MTLVLDADRPSRNPISAGSIKRSPLDAQGSVEMGDRDAAQRGHWLAQRGYWYDAYDFFADLSARHPQSPGVAAHRDRLFVVVKSAE